MAPARVLVIAPNSDMRRSLAFALEAEGYVVTSHPGMLGGEAARGYDAVVLDHKAAKGDRGPIVLLCRMAPVILLAGSPQPWLLTHVSQVVETPVIGESLTLAVRRQVERSQSP